MACVVCIHFTYVYFVIYHKRFTNQCAMIRVYVHHYVLNSKAFLDYNNNNNFKCHRISNIHNVVF
jgi:hypothetical protein